METNVSSTDFLDGFLKEDFAALDIIGYSPSRKVPVWRLCRFLPDHVIVVLEFLTKFSITTAAAKCRLSAAEWLA